MCPVFTLGHSTLSDREFVQAARGIDLILDVRSHPGSSHFPQFDKERMEAWLPKYGIEYEWWPGLGGWSLVHARDKELCEQMAKRDVDVAAYAGPFPKQRIAARRSPSDVAGPVWTNVGLRDYSWYMSTDSFLEAADALIHRYSARDGKRVAMVCAEAVWFKCHRGMIADYLVWRGVPCYHLPIKLPKRETTPRFRPHLDVMTDRLDRYEPAIKERWEQWVCQAKVNQSA